MRNQDKLFTAEGGRQRKKKKVTAKRETLQEMVAKAITEAEQQSHDTQKENITTQEIILEAELNQVKEELILRTCKRKKATNENTTLFQN